MITVVVNKEQEKGTVEFNGTIYKVNCQKVNKESVKPGTYWINLKPLGTPKMWHTVNFNDYEGEEFEVEIDETAHRTVTPRVSRLVTLGNIKDFLSDEDKTVFDELKAKADAEAKRQADEAEANKPKKATGKKMTIEEKKAKLLAEMEALEKAAAEGKTYLEEAKPRKTKKQAIIEDLDEDTTGIDVLGLDKPLIGEYDLIVQDGRDVCIVDWKTSANRWPAGKADRDLQATVFSYAYEKQNNTAPLFRFDVITKTKNPGCESHYTSRGFHDFRRFEALANRAQYAINKGVFLPNETSFACGECPYRDRCRTWHLRKWR